MAAKTKDVIRRECIRIYNMKQKYRKRGRNNTKYLFLLFFSKKKANDKEFFFLFVNFVDFLFIFFIALPENALVELLV